MCTGVERLLGSCNADSVLFSPFSLGSNISDISGEKDERSCHKQYKETADV